MTTASIAAAFRSCEMFEEELSRRVDTRSIGGWQRRPRFHHHDINVLHDSELTRKIIYDLLEIAIRERTS